MLALDRATGERLWTVEGEGHRKDYWDNRISADAGDSTVVTIDIGTGAIVVRDDRTGAIRKRLGRAGADGAVVTDQSIAYVKLEGSERRLVVVR